jgi:hypothetical protein
MSNLKKAPTKTAGKSVAKGIDATSITESINASIAESINASVNQTQGAGGALNDMRRFILRRLSAASLPV